MVRNFISEDDIEQALLQKLNTQFGFKQLLCFTARPENWSDKARPNGLDGEATGSQ